jgi:hypothetical protein
MRANPKPQQPFLDVYRESAVTRANADAPETPDFLEP